LTISPDVAHQSFALAGKLVVANDDEFQPLLRDLFLPAPVVDSSLLPSWDTADGQRAGLVKERHGLEVLPFLVLDYEAETGIEGIDRKGHLSAVLAGISEKPVKAVLPKSHGTEQFVAQIDHVLLVLP